jgi:hypothetical protein
VRRFRRKAKGWSANVESTIRKRKTHLVMECDRLDKITEDRNMTTQEREMLSQMQKELNDIWFMEETKARQRSRDRNIMEGDKDTRYFHTMANQRRRKTTIHSIYSPEGTVETTEDIIRVATSYYKELLKYETRPNINVADDFFPEGDKLAAEEVEILERGFSEEFCFDYSYTKREEC